MKTIFSIENQSLLPIRDIDALCGIEEVIDKFGGGIKNGNIRFPDSHADTLSPGEQMSLPCDRVVGMRTGTERAKIVIKVSYRPDWVWWHRHIDFPVQAERGKDGTWVWRRLPR